MACVIQEKYELVQGAAEDYDEFISYIKQGDWKSARNYYLTCNPELACYGWECQAAHCYKSRRILSESNGFIASILQVSMTGEGDDLSFRKVPPQVKLIKGRNGKYVRRLQHDEECDHGDGDMSTYSEPCGCCRPQPQIATRVLMEVMKWTALKGWPEDTVYEVLKHMLPGIYQKFADGMEALHEQPRKYHCAMQCSVVQDLESFFFTLRTHVSACQRLIEDGSLARGENLLRTFVDEVAAQHRHHSDSQLGFWSLALMYVCGFALPTSDLCSYFPTYDNGANLTLEERFRYVFESQAQGRSMAVLKATSVMLCQNCGKFRKTELKKCIGSCCKATNERALAEAKRLPLFKLCSSCSGAMYCSRECQHLDWKLHKAKCHRLAIGRKVNRAANE